MTVSEMNMSARFAESKEAWAKAEAERLDREIEERRRQDEADRIEAARIRAEEEKMVAEIEADATVDEYVDLYVVNALERDRSKACRVSEVNPYHTSQICSCCGHWEEGQRDSRDWFICKNPNCKKYGEKVHADLSAPVLTLPRMVILL